VVRRWEAATGKELEPLKAEGVPNSGTIACTLASAADGKTLVVAFRAKMLRAWDLTSGKPLPQFAGDHGQIKAIALSPDGKLLASGGYDSDQTYFCRLWDVATGKEVRRLRGHRGGILTLAFSPVPLKGAAPARWLLTAGSGDGTVRLWDTPTGEEVRQLKGDGKSSVRAVAFSADGKRLAAASDAVRVWDTGTWEVVQRFPQAARQLAFLADGTTLAGASSGAVRLWDVKTGKESRAFGGHESRLTSVTWSPDGRTAATGAWYGTIRLWDTATGKALHEFAAIPQGNVAFSPDGKFLAASCQEDSIQYPAEKGRVLVTGSRLRLWEVATGKEVGPFKGHKSQPNYLTFAPDGKAILTADAWDGSVRAWDRATGEERLLSKLDSGAKELRLFPMLFSPDARLIAVGEPRLDNTTALMGRCSAYLYDAATGKRLHAFKVGGNQIHSLAFSPDGKLLAASVQGFRGDFTYLWDTATGKQVGTLPFAVEALAFSADGRLLAGADRGRVIRLWEVATRKECGRFEGHREAVYTLAFSSDGRGLLSGSADTTALVWDMTGLRTGGRPPAALTAGEVEALWAALAGDDAEAAWRAVWKLAAAPGASVPLLKQHLHPVPRPGERRLAELIDDLSNGAFAVRQKAARELESLQEVAAPALRTALDRKLTEEARRRIEQLLANLDGSAVSPETLRTFRALTALEHARTPEARRLLEALAGGAPAARLTREARQALDRLRLSAASGL
jgi:WD40 repeat protein